MLIVHLMKREYIPILLIKGSLWCFNSSSQTFTRVFSFKGEETDSVREGYDAHNIKIMKIEDNGDATFLVSWIYEQRRA